MTEKEVYTKEEIIKLVEKKSNYGYYPNNKYGNPFEKLHQNALNCSDRDKLPPELQVSLQDYRVEMNVPKEILKEKIDYPKTYFDELHEKIINKATAQLVEDMKKEYPEYPDEILTAFVKQFIDLEITNDYNVRTQEHSLQVTPIWKDVNRIDFDSEFQEILNEYFKTH